MESVGLFGRQKSRKTEMGGKFCPLFEYLLSGVKILQIGHDLQGGRKGRGEMLSN